MGLSDQDGISGGTWFAFPSVPTPPHHLPMKILIKTEKILLLFNNMDSRLWEKVYFIEVNHSLLPLLCIDPLWDYSFLQFPITRRKGLWQTRIGVHLCTPD